MPEDPEQIVKHRFIAAIEHMRQHGLTDTVAGLEPLLDQTRSPILRGEIAKLLGFYWLRKTDHAKAVAFSDMAAELLPQDPDAPYNAIFALFQSQQWEAAADRALAALQRLGEDFRWHNILCTALGALGRYEEARHHGTRSLILKDAAATAAPFPIAELPVPPFDASRRARNVIGFSLFGAEARYTEGAVLNARAARFIYPAWTCRFYIDDSVPKPVVDRLMAEGAQVLKVGGLPVAAYGPLWRFLVADDAEVDRYLIRDADSVVNTRERVAVDEWLASDRHFHVMRDNYNHSELVLAGMWGGVHGALPTLGTAMQTHINSRRHVLGRTEDQEFLRESLWPTIRQSVLVHDSQFDFGPHRDFPAVGGLHGGFFVGCDGRQMLGLI